MKAVTVLLFVTLHGSMVIEANSVSYARHLHIWSEIHDDDIGIIVVNRHTLNLTQYGYYSRLNVTQGQMQKRRVRGHCSQAGLLLTPIYV